MLRAEDGATFRLTIEAAADRVKVSWTVAQGSGEAAVTETDSSLVATVEDARRWGHAAARARGFKKIKVKNSIAAAA